MTPKVLSKRLKEKIIMSSLLRVSPVSLPGKILKSEERGGYSIVLSYKNEPQNSPWLVDLSHRTKLDFQCNGNVPPSAMGIDLPKVPGRAVVEKQWIVSALGAAQFSFIHIGNETAPPQDDPGFTDITDGRCLFAIGGKGASLLMEKFTRMNFNDPALESPCLLQGPMVHTFGQLHVLGKEEHRIFLIALGRGYARSVAHAILDTGASSNLAPAGENRFTQALAHV